MDQTESAPAAVPVVRQLDFGLGFKASTKPIGNAHRNLILPEHPQARVESKLLALAESQKQHTGESFRPPPLVQQMRPMLGKVVAPPKSPPLAFPQMMGIVKSLSTAPRLAHPVKTAHMPKPAAPPLLRDSPRSRDRFGFDQKDGTPKKQKQCHCKNSRCLKLYCECFASGIYCDGCNCINCHNKIEYEEERKEMIDAILERNPNAFRPKVANSPHGAANGGAEHNRGCNCKKSGCLKRYCECFQANILCSDKCKCMDCKNFEGSEERTALFNEHPTTSLTLMQQAVNAAINGAVGSACNKSRNQQIVFGATSDGQLTSRVPQSHQEIHMTPSDMNCSPIHAQQSKPMLETASEPSNSTYRSPLAGILQLQHVKDLCTLLVEVSAEAAKSFSEGKCNQSQRDNGVSCRDQENRDRILSSESASSSIENGRPLSPGTMALMCNERDSVFMTDEDPSAVTECNTKTSMMSESTYDLNELYVEQERLVLTRFHSFLNGLIVHDCIEETKMKRIGEDLCCKVSADA